MQAKSLHNIVQHILVEDIGTQSEFPHHNWLSVDTTTRTVKMECSYKFTCMSSFIHMKLTTVMLILSLQLSCLSYMRLTDLYSLRKITRHQRCLNHGQFCSNDISAMQLLLLEIHT